MGPRKNTSQKVWSHNSESGFTLIELMVALLVGLLISAAIVKVYVDTTRVYRWQGALSQVQENGRFAAEFLRRDVRLAGNFGCDSSKVPSVHNQTPPTFVVNNQTQPIGGTDGTGTNPDILILRGAVGMAVDVTSPEMTKTSDDISVKKGSGLCDPTCTRANRFALVSDCDSADIFGVSGASLGGKNTKDSLQHASGTVNTQGELSKSYVTGFQVFPRVQMLRETHYCIGRAEAWTAANGIMALKRLINPTAAQNCSVVGEELVEGIHNLQVVYGENTNISQCQAAAVESNKAAPTRYIPGPPTNTNLTWCNVVSVRIQLLSRSLSGNITSDPVPYVLNGTTITPQDSYLRKVFTNTITLRNRGKRS